MTNKELREELKKFPDDWLVVAQDGLDPSDWCGVKEVEPLRGRDSDEGVTVLSFRAGGPMFFS